MIWRHDLGIFFLVNLDGLGPPSVNFGPGPQVLDPWPASDPPTCLPDILFEKTYHGMQSFDAHLIERTDYSLQINK